MASLTTKQTDCIVALLAYERTHPGERQRSGHGLSGAALASLERKGLVRGHFNALLGTKTWSLTETGRAALAPAE